MLLLLRRPSSPWYRSIGAYCNQSHASNARRSPLSCIEMKWRVIFQGVADRPSNLRFLTCRLQPNQVYPLHAHDHRTRAAPVFFASLNYYRYACVLVRPKTIVFGRTSVLRMMFFYFFLFNARSPRCVGRPAWNFARWSVLGRIL